MGGKGRGNEHYARDTNETAIDLLQLCVETQLFLLWVEHAGSRRIGIGKDKDFQVNHLCASSALCGRSTSVESIIFACRTLYGFETWPDEMTWFFGPCRVL